MLSLLFWWYDWGVFAGLFVVAVITFWIFYDAQQRGIEAVSWKILAGLGILLILPTLVIKLFEADVVVSMLASALILDWGTVMSTWRTITLCGYVGILGLVLASVAAFGYAVAGTREMAYLPPSIPRQLPPTERAVPPPTPVTRERAAAPRAAPRTPRLDRTRRLREEVPATAWLAVKSGAWAGKQFGLVRGKNTIGRDGSRCDIVLDDGATSAQHAQVNFENGQFVIYDLASLNGTFVDRQKVQRQLLMDGDLVRIGNTTFVFKKV